MLRRPAYVVRAPASEPGVRSLPERGLFFFCLTLTLLVAQVFADDHNSAITTNHLALVADRLDARLNLHGSFIRHRRADALPATTITCSGRRSGREKGRTG